MMRYTVLLVEDDPDDAELVRSALRDVGRDDELVVAGTGERALQLLHEEGVRPTVVLLDLSLPGIGGFDVLDSIRTHESTRSLPVAVLSGDRTDELVKRCYEHGTTTFVQKPNRLALLTDELRQLFAWLVLAG